MHIAPFHSSRISRRLRQSASSTVLNWNWRRRGGNGRYPSSKEAEKRLRQHLEPLEPRVLLAADLTGLATGLSEYLSGAEAAIESKAFNQDLPLVGDNLSTTGADFLSQLTTALTSAITGGTPPTTVSGLQTALNSALSGLQIDTFTVNVNNGNPADLDTLTDLRISIDILENQAVTTDFEIGLDGLPVVTDGTDITGALTWNLNLDFGIDSTGFYVDTQAREFDVGVLFNPGPTFHLQGNFGLLDIGLSERTDADPANDTLLTGNIVVDLASTAKLRTAVADVAAATPTVNLDGRIDMTVVMGAGLTYNSTSNVYESDSPFPTFTSHFSVKDWHVGAAAAPDVNFDDVNLDIGGISRFFSDTFGDVSDLLEPLEPIIDFFNSPTPLIKDIPPLDALLRALSDTGEDTPLESHRCHQHVARPQHRHGSHKGAA